MFRNYLIAALRNLARNKLYAAINIAGLALGFTAVILIYLFLRDDFSYDRWIPGYDRIYRISSVIRPPDRGPLTMDPVPQETAGWLKLDFNSVQAVARLSHPQPVGLRRGLIEANEQLYWADPTFLDVVPLPLVAGDAQHALERPDSIVLTRKLARKYFGRDAPIGESIHVDRDHVMRVTAVLEDLPSNTHLDIELLGAARASWSSLTYFDSHPQADDEFEVRAHTYFRVAPGVSAAALQREMPQFLKRHKRTNPAAQNGMISFRVQPIAAIHFEPGELFAMKPGGNRTADYAILAAGLLTALIAGINFVSLSTARATRRSVEVGVRKASGAQRGDLIVQFIGEALIYALLGALAAVALSELALPYYNAFLQRSIAFDYWRDARLGGGIFLGIIVAGFLAGVYPALVLSAFRPTQVLKAAAVQRFSRGRGRQYLVTVQFAMLIVLIVGVGLVYRQTRFAMKQALRIDDDQVLVLREGCVESFKNQVRALPGVRSAACSSLDALDMDTWLALVRTSAGVQVAARRIPVDYDFFDLFGVKLLAGRPFSRAFSTDTASPDPATPFSASIILNETAARQLGFRTAQDAIGHTASVGSVRATSGQSQIVGIVPDFHVNASREPVGPAVFYWDPPPPLFSLLNVKLSGRQIPETLEAIDAAWHALGKVRPLQRQFLDQRIQSLYVTELRQERLLAIATGAALLIACLGLFGLSAYSAERRTMEIGVRKAMGAETVHILRLLLWQFSKPVLWANLLAWPAAYLILHRWLEGFAYHIQMGIMSFVVAAALALLIAWMTVVGHALRLASAKPVAALHYE